MVWLTEKEQLQMLSALTGVDAVTFDIEISEFHNALHSFIYETEWTLGVVTAVGWDSYITQAMQEFTARMPDLEARQKVYALTVLLMAHATGLEANNSNKTRH